MDQRLNGAVLFGQGGSRSTIRDVDEMALSSDEIEVACDALWHRKTAREFTAEEAELWERLQGARHGDYGGAASIELAEGDITLVRRALKLIKSAVPLDDDELALLQRLDRDSAS